MNLPRNNLKQKYPRYHYNKLGKSKQSFETEEKAQQYLLKMHLFDYSIYKCKYCNQYHIAH